MISSLGMNLNNLHVRGRVHKDGGRSERGKENLAVLSCRDAFSNCSIGIAAFVVNGCIVVLMHPNFMIISSTSCM